MCDIHHRPYKYITIASLSTSPSYSSQREQSCLTSNSSLTSPSSSSYSTPRHALGSSPRPSATRTTRRPSSSSLPASATPTTSRGPPTSPAAPGTASSATPTQAEFSTWTSAPTTSPAPSPPPLATSPCSPTSVSNTPPSSPAPSLTPSPYSIPSSPAFLSELKDLFDLDLSGNLLTGPIPEPVSSLPKLDRLTLFGNKLTGTIPPSLFHGLTGRNLLHLSDNLLTGEIPRSLGDADLAYIYLAGNRFTGDASFLVGESKQTYQIDLSRNRLEMNMSSLRFPQNFNMLDLSNNRIYGSIPATVAKLHNLYTFNVSFNRLCGRIPIGGNMKLFDGSCYTHNKCLCGSPLPSCRA